MQLVFIDDGRWVGLGVAGWGRGLQGGARSQERPCEPAETAALLHVQGCRQLKTSSEFMASQLLAVPCRMVLNAQATLHRSHQAVSLPLTPQVRVCVCVWQELLPSCAGTCCSGRLRHQGR